MKKILHFLNNFVQKQKMPNVMNKSFFFHFFLLILHLQFLKLNCYFLFYTIFTEKRIKANVSSLNFMQSYNNCSDKQTKPKKKPPLHVVPTQ